MNRRTFLTAIIGKFLLLMAIPLFTRCGKYNSNYSSKNSPIPSTQGTLDIVTISSDAGGHTHTFIIPRSVLANPPTNGYTATTSTDGGHFHSVTLSKVQLLGLSAGGHVTTASSLTTHTHSFTFFIQ